MVDPHLADVGRRLYEADGIEATHLTVTSGAMDAVERVLAALDFRIGDRLGVEDPGHIPVHQLARSSGLDLVPLPVDAFGITPEGLDTALAAGLDAIVVTPRAQNPTGAAFTAERAAQLTNLLSAHPAVAVIQDDHAGHVAGTGYHPISSSNPRWATMRSLGKSLGPDMRVALVVGDEITVRRISTAISNGPGWVSFVLQRAAAHLLDDPATIELLDKTAHSYELRRTRLIAALASYDISASGRSGLNVWIPTAHEQAAIEAARVGGFAIRGAAGYRIRSAPAVRVTITDLHADQIDRVAEALASIHRAAPHAPTM